MPKPLKQERFLRLLDEHRKILFKVAHSYSRDPSDREDLVQEIALQLWRSFDRYDERRPFPTWMYRVALNVAISFVRRESRRRRMTVPLDEAILEVVEAPGKGEGEATMEQLRRVLDGLAAIDRALVLLYLDGHSHQAIADILGISRSNVGTKVGRIKERMRLEWSEPTIGGINDGTG